MTTEKDNWALGKTSEEISEEREPGGEEPGKNWLSGLVGKKEEAESSDQGWLSGLIAGEESAAETCETVTGDASLVEPTPEFVEAPEPEAVRTPEVVSKPESSPKLAAPPKPEPVLEFHKPPEPKVEAPPKLEPLQGPPTGPVSKSTPPREKKAETPSEGPREPFLAPRVSGRQMVSFYRSLSVMLSSGVQLFACFEFLSRDAESKELSAACKRIGQRLVEGYPLPRAVAPERSFFDDKTVRLLEVGYKSGALNKILKRLAEDEEASWKLESQLRSQLYYPLGIAALGTLGVLVLPPLVLNDLLQQVVKFTDEPPAITQALLDFSAFLSSPWTIGLALLTVFGLGFFIRTPHWMRLKRRLELFYWEIPGLSELWQSVVAVRFLSVFALTYDCGLPATQCLLLSSGSTGSTLVETKGPIMKETLVAGGTLRETLESGDFLPPLVLEAVEAGQQTGKVADLLERSADILSTELQTRIETVAKLVEPLVLTILGFFVGLFALGCLLPIIGLVEKI